MWLAWGQNFVFALSHKSQRLKKLQKVAKCSAFGDSKWSEWGDSNARPPAPKAGALPTAQHPDAKLLYPSTVAISREILRQAPGYGMINEQLKQGRTPQ